MRLLDPDRMEAEEGEEERCWRKEVRMLEKERVWKREERMVSGARVCRLVIVMGDGSELAGRP